MQPRETWTHWLLRIANPVFNALAEGELHQRMPIEEPPEGGRATFARLEAAGRSLAGIAPWLENTECPRDEAAQRNELAAKVLASIKHGVDSSSPDFMNFTDGGQPLVDAAFLAQGLLRGWNSVWLQLDAETQGKVIDCLKATRAIKPAFCNWLLFSAMIEAFLARADADWDRMRIDYAIRQHMQWYVGDGAYGDGPDFHWDYYNSFVIQPMLHDIVHSGGEVSEMWAQFAEAIDRRFVRYAAVQERLISPEGAYPPIGRSLAYRIGAFQALSQVALKQMLPEDLPPAAVRCALTAVLERQMNQPGTFDDNNWLRIGFCGAQPSIGERYICTGSLYLCLCGFLHLGLPKDDVFWSEPDAAWTSARAWSGEDLPCDHAIHG